MFQIAQLGIVAKRCFGALKSNTVFLNYPNFLPLNLHFFSFFLLSLQDRSVECLSRTQVILLRPLQENECARRVYPLQVRNTQVYLLHRGNDIIFVTCEAMFFGRQPFELFIFIFFCDCSQFSPHFFILLFVEVLFIITEAEPLAFLLGKL